MKVALFTIFTSDFDIKKKEAQVPGKFAYG